MAKAILLDRDGVLNRDSRGYTYRISDYDLLPNVPEALKRLKDAGYLLLVITNQSGVARGFYTMADVFAFHNHMQADLLTHGVQIDQFYICPHHQDGTVPEYAKECECRKPRTKLIEQAIKDFALDIESCFVVGDKYSDVDCGKNAGIKSIQVASKESHLHPYAIAQVRSLNEACDFIFQ